MKEVKNIGKTEKIKAIGLYSGGLDSALAIRLIEEQGVEVIAFHYVMPFSGCGSKKGYSASELAKKHGINLVEKQADLNFIKIIRHPKYGYGSAINPCIDCKIFIFKEAKKYAKQIGAKFLFTGEVVGQRPMSQHMKQLGIIENDSGLKGKLLRPLSAKLMLETAAEKNGWVDRNKLLEIRGRRRVEQISLAKEYKITDFLCGTGGCKLCEKEYAKRVKDLFNHSKKISMNDFYLLNHGRHFRIGEDAKIVVGRDERDNANLQKIKQGNDYIFEAADCIGPLTILRGKKTKENIRIAAELTARYSDSKENKVKINYGTNSDKPDKAIVVGKATEEFISKTRL